MGKRFLAVLALVLLLSCEVATEQPFRVTFIDVGQGAAVLLEAPEASILVDSGRSGAAYEHLQQSGIRELDLIVASHPHADHVGGFPPILENLHVREIWYNGQAHGTQTFERFIDAALQSTARYVEPTRGQVREYGALRVEVLHPAASAADYDGHVHDKNVVLRAVYGDFAVLLPGDAEADVEDELLRAGLDLKATVLKMGHHGSRTSTSASFAEAVQPEIAVYQASESNQYGHPHDEAIASLTAVGAQVLGTNVHGTIRIETDGTAYQVITERSAPVRAP